MIATPIGNLGDLSTRAIETLRLVDEVWCEDTRHTQALLAALDIKGKVLRRVDQHTSRADLQALLVGVRSMRQWIGVVTDAGTPGLSDPGALLMDEAEEFPEIVCEPVPGPSALAAMMSIAGGTGSSLYFHGFFPRTKNESFELLTKLKNSALSPNCVFFESPHRIRETWKVLEEWCERAPAEPRFVFAKELTKIHEAVFRGRGIGFLKGLQDQQVDERGEWVFSVLFSKESLDKKAITPEWEPALECLLKAGIAPKSASLIVMERFSVAKNLAYKWALEFQKK
ncbi:MAG: hypothetical protein KGP28_09020 [Bdellovibrionales bacterium]|nr:hypothetical protein [Bdellovibrionales bacterium]